jgi:hypothetical protein
MNDYKLADFFSYTRLLVSPLLVASIAFVIALALVAHGQGGSPDKARKHATPLLRQMVGTWDWDDPIFCTRCYESNRVNGSSFSGVSQVLRSVAEQHLRHTDANAAGVWYVNALCGRRWL